MHPFYIYYIEKEKGTRLKSKEREEGESSRLVRRG